MQWLNTAWIVGIAFDGDFVPRSSFDEKGQFIDCSLSACWRVFLEKFRRDIQQHDPRLPEPLVTGGNQMAETVIIS